MGRNQALFCSLPKESLGENHSFAMILNKLRRYCIVVSTLRQFELKVSKTKKQQMGTAALPIEEIQGGSLCLEKNKPSKTFDSLICKVKPCIRQKLNLAASISIV